jgi:hypothetical protein
VDSKRRLLGFGAIFAPTLCGRFLLALCQFESALKRHDFSRAEKPRNKMVFRP